MKKIILPMLYCIALLTFAAACNTGLSKDQQLFLDYAKLEDRYHNTGFYLNLDMYSDTIAAPEFHDADFNIDSFTENIKRSFKLVRSNNSISPQFDGPALQFPHQYIFMPTTDSAYQVSLSVFVPEHFSAISLTKKDIGRRIEKEETEFVLLDINNDAATLLITDKANRQSYDYTYEFSERKLMNKDKEDTINHALSYEYGLFFRESVTEPNESNDFVKDSLLRINYSRVNISLQDEAGKTLLSDGRINNFRHYLWYRNNDMPYQEMQGDYMDLKSRYIEADKDSMHNFHPIEIVNIKGRGKLGSVEIFVRSNKGKVVTIDLGKQRPQAPTEIKNNSLSYHAKQKTDTASLTKTIKINYSLLQGKENKAAAILLYASLPESYKNNGLNMQFEDVWLMYANDSVAIEMERADDYINIGTSRAGSNTIAVKMLMPQMDIEKIKGKINISTSGVYDSSFAVNSLPASIKMFNNGRSFSFAKDAIPIISLRDIFGLKTADSKQALHFDYDETNSSDAGNITIHFAEPPAVLILRGNKDDGIDFSKAFELSITPTKK